MHYDKESIKYYNQWIKECDFDLISTRDELTHNFLKDKVKNLYNGIDLGFFDKILYASKQVLLITRNWCVSILIKYLSPVFEDKNGAIIIDDKTYSYKKSLSNEPRGFIKKVFPFIRPYFKKFELISMNGYKIIRTDHRFNPTVEKIYSDKNSFAMDTPEGYLLAYANSKLTLSNRVHASVATLSYGNYAMYFSDSKRANLLNRLELEEIYHKPVALDPSRLIQEKEGLIKFIKNQI